MVAVQGQMLDSLKVHNSHFDFSLAEKLGLHQRENAVKSPGAVIFIKMKNHILSVLCATHLGVIVYCEPSCKDAKSKGGDSDVS